MAKKITQPSFSVKFKVKTKKPLGPPAKLPNLEKRSREYLTVAEVNKLIKAAKRLGRHGERDSLMVLVMYRHALRVGELVDLRWDQMDLNRGRIHVNRLKNGDPSVHYLEGDEIRALRKLRRDYPQTDFVFESERQGPLTINAVHKMVARAGIEAELELSAHPHMLRHGKGYQLASEGVDTRAIQAYMGHKNIQHTVLYTQLNPKRFKGFGRDVKI
ncbi:MAG: type 1 fimbriae regulatory protein FimE [Cyanobacteriota bacterium erpe_2018_sw_21hr_WHONDRS-SW48-000092_B_bin.40]|jgi:type 1 fimbriae regulatory protein FimB/type 1 fimbriae regulatory protein FimE|nr:type 1 fimbriae regulatory protein FimE [Cyanobacteriota bacterium erpe_2018_sw_21hr_WHONDRS-SW48-000092_B_bin.40]